MDGGPKDQHATLSHKRPRGSSMTPQQKIKGEFTFCTCFCLVNYTYNVCVRVQIENCLKFHLCEYFNFSLKFAL